MPALPVIPLTIAILSSVALGAFGWGGNHNDWRLSVTKTKHCMWCKEGRVPNEKGEHWIVQSIIPAKIKIVKCTASKPDACDHDFQGWRDFPDGNGGEQVCTKCGIGAMAHTLRTGV